MASTGDIIVGDEGAELCRDLRVTRVNEAESLDGHLGATALGD